MNQRVNPTQLAYERLTESYNWFNQQLFNSSLPPCLITFQRHAKAFGYFSGKRFIPAYGASQKPTDEIALNPMHFGGERTAAKVLSTLVHEMVHCWQAHFGKEPTRCYHDREWAKKMKEVGLHPSSTGQPDGKETGPKVSHYIMEGGPYAIACEKFLTKYGDDWLWHDIAGSLDRAFRRAKAGKEGGEGGEGGEDGGDGEGKAKSKGRIKFQCPECKLNAWAKPSADINCNTCDKKLEPQEDATKEGDDDGED